MVTAVIVLSYRTVETERQLSTLQTERESATEEGAQAKSQVEGLGQVAKSLQLSSTMLKQRFKGSIRPQLMPKREPVGTKSKFPSSAKEERVARNSSMDGVLKLLHLQAS